MKDIVKHVIDSGMRRHLLHCHRDFLAAYARGDGKKMAQISMHLAEAYNAFGNIMLSVKWAEEYARWSGDPVFYPYWKKNPCLLN